jgi:hypothetical protein
LQAFYPCLSVSIRGLKLNCPLLHFAANFLFLCSR